MLRVVLSDFSLDIPALLIAFRRTKSCRQRWWVDARWCQGFATWTSRNPWKWLKTAFELGRFSRVLSCESFSWGESGGQPFTIPVHELKREFFVFSVRPMECDKEKSFSALGRAKASWTGIPKKALSLPRHYRKFFFLLLATMKISDSSTLDGRTRLHQFVYWLIKGVFRTLNENDYNIIHSHRASPHSSVRDWTRKLNSRALPCM